MEIPKLIIEWDGENPTSAMCSVCRAIFPTVEWNGPDANRRLVETAFQAHVNAEHRDQPPSSKAKQGNCRCEGWGPLPHSS